MTASAHRRRRLALTIGLLGTALASACIEVRDASDDRKAAADSAAGAIAAAQAASPVSSQSAATAQADSFTARFGPDSATFVRGGPLSTPEATAALQSDTAHAVTEMDSSAAGGSGADLGAASGGLLVPVRGIEPSQLFDTYSEQRGGGSRAHEALDIAAPRGTPVLSATGGRVLKLFDSQAGGKMVYAADSSERFILMYAHLDSYANGLAEGRPLKRGQVIGAVGTTGNAPPNLPHLHFAVARSNDVKQWWKGSPVNPFPLLVK
jgi:murein DD-endopeptidase MepM/ murein hydrolase activator NlpD